MGFLSETGGVLKELLHPANYAKTFAEGLHEIERPAKSLFSGEAFKDPVSLLKSTAEFPIQSLLGGAMLYPALKWDRPDLDEAGPFESMADRGSGLYMSAATWAPSLFSKSGFLPSLAGLMLAEPVAKKIFRGAGRAADYVSNNRPSPNELNERFMGRISPRAEELKSQGLDNDSAMRQSTMELLQQVPEYLDWAK